MVHDGNNDFGVGLVFGSSGNHIEDNTMGGNTNGVLLHADASGNVIRGNIIAGNPLLLGARNTIERNWCITYLGPGPAPCPNFPGSHGSDDDDD